jgi:hypothetical protein
VWDDDPRQKPKAKIKKERKGKKKGKWKGRKCPTSRFYSGMHTLEPSHFVTVTGSQQQRKPESAFFAMLDCAREKNSSSVRQRQKTNRGLSARPPPKPATPVQQTVQPFHVLNSMIVVHVASLCPFGRRFFVIASRDIVP